MRKFKSRPILDVHLWYQLKRNGLRLFKHEFDIWWESWRCLFGFLTGNGSTGPCFQRILLIFSRAYGRKSIAWNSEGNSDGVSDFNKNVLRARGKADWSWNEGNKRSYVYLCYGLWLLVSNRSTIMNPFPLYLHFCLSSSDFTNLVFDHGRFASFDDESSTGDIHLLLHKF